MAIVGTGNIPGARRNSGSIENAGNRWEVRASRSGLTVLRGLKLASENRASIVAATFPVAKNENYEQGAEGSQQNAEKLQQSI